ncbi:MAG: hypothetical protein IT559_05290 [Alphaproteobacteria bacterium]|nr:hypothetical protein [Alphaproteobacteria bacterium]
MSLSLLPNNHTVLMISDEFLSIYAVTARSARLVETVPWEAEDFEANVAGIIAKDCGRKSVLILNDMVEQHYRKERVIRTGVGFADRTALLRRKLNVAFSGFPIRAAYPLKEKMPKTDKQPAADIYIFAAVAGTDQFTKTMNATRSSLASVSGLCLLPVESSDMIGALSAKLVKKDKAKAEARWSIFMGQHRNGSLRQVVTKNGELALTRMSPISNVEENAEIWAQDLHQEFKATMSYLSRLGYEEHDGLDVVVIATHAAGEILTGLLDGAYDLHVMTVMEVAQALGLSIGRQDSLHYADPLHVAWVGRKRRLILSMKAPIIDDVSRPRRMAAAVMAALVLGGGFQGYQFIQKAASVSEIGSEISQREKQKAQLDVGYEREIRRLNDVGFDARRVQSAIAVNAALEAQNIKVLNVINGMGKALGKNLRIDSLNIERPKISSVEKFIDGMGKKAPPLFEARMRMTYPATANVDAGNKEVRDLRDRLEIALPDHKVRVTKFLKDYEYTEGLVVEAGDLEKENIQQDFVAEILVQGPPQSSEKVIKQ